MHADNEKHRAYLKRLAFGRTSTPAEKQRAFEALRQLLQAETDDIRAVDAVEVAEELPNSSAPAEAATLLPRLATLPRWAIPAVAIGLVALGALGGAAASSANASAPPVGSPTHTTSASVTVKTRTTARDGDIHAAARWFADEQTAADALPYPPGSPRLGSMDPATSRLALHTPGEFPWDLRVARTVEGGFCLHVAYLVEDRAESICTTSDGFVETGLRIESIPGSSVNWDGKQISLTLSK